MANHAILIQNAVQAKNIDTLNRSVKSADDVDNGSVLALSGKTGVDGEGEVWSAGKPATGALKLSLSLVGTTYISAATGNPATQRIPAYQFEVVDNSSNLWMAYEPEIVTIVVNGKKFRGVDNDVRDFYNIAGTPFTAFKPQVGDLITITNDGLAGTKGSNTFVVASNGSYQLTWAAAAN